MARYLAALAVNLPAGRDRDRIQRLADLTWMTVFQVSPIKVVKGNEVVRFLRRHAQTYFALYDIDAAAEEVRNSPPPAVPKTMFRPRNVLSPGMSVHGAGTPQLKDDLSERLYAAYWALQFSGIANTRGKVAVALNGAGLTTRARLGRAKHWEGEQVADRVTQFERHLVDAPTQPVPDGWKKRVRAHLAEQWVGQFRHVRDHRLGSERSVGPDFRI